MAFQESLFIRKIQVRFMSEVMFFVVRCNKDARPKKEAFPLYSLFPLKRYTFIPRDRICRIHVSSRKKKETAIITRLL